ncbi:MAG: hypothetical protein QXX19_03585 [Candidatus Caldarchaeum sp.]
MRAFSVLTKVLLATWLIVACSGFEAGAGSFFSYAYTVSTDSGRSLSGTVSSTVIGVLDDGRIRLRLEASFNDGLATLEKNMPGQAFKPFILDLGSMQGRYSLRRDNFSITISVVKTGEGSVSVGGRTYGTEKYMVSALAERLGRTVSLEAEAEIIKGSSVVYSLSATFTEDARRSGTFTLQLTDTNTDLTAFTQHRSGESQFFQLASLALSSGALDQADIPTALLQQPLNVRPTQSTANDRGNETERIALFGLAGVSALAAAGLLGFRARKTPSTSGERKPHYV